jgi:hypothetical protein
MGGVTAGPDRTEPAIPSSQGSPPPPPAQDPPEGPPPVAATPPLTQATQAIGAMPGAASGEACPNCGAGMSPDQRYCLNCGHRRGDPRLPFMDAVVFMEAMSGPPGGPAAAPPPPPPEQKPRFNPSATLIAGIATLILAVGVGVLIGQSGNNGSAPAAATPQVIKVEGNGTGGGEESAGTGGQGSEASAGATKKKSNKKQASKGKASPKQAKKAEAKAETGESGTAKSVEEVIKPENGVKIAPPEQKIGGECEEGTAGCTGGKFEGEFFGE